ncbi:MAG: nucleoid occlusion factor SlmA [Gammaproteobacteria bacterium]|nr:nucleoid occlusion factor SlmA [Gammaproteobacteria bacterium]
MSEETVKKSRKQQILEALCGELEKSPGARITTANLARAVGVSEAALYRHFPSKARMFEGLIEFAEDAIFSLINRIMEEHPSVQGRCERILSLLLGFSAKNPGITRILLGDALVGETDRLRLRVAQFFDRLNTQFKQVLREGQMREELSKDVDVTAMSNMLLAVAEGRMGQYVRSDFADSPMVYWEKQWPVIRAGLFQSSLQS